MTRTVALLLLSALSIALAWSVLAVFNAGFEAGGIYPAYSSLRKDPDGTSVLFESLKRLAPATERSYLPLENALWSHRTLLLLGAGPEQLLPGNALDHRVLENLARQGNRIVLGFTPGLSVTPEVVAEIEKAWDVKIQIDPDSDDRRMHFSAHPHWRMLHGEPESADVIERPYGAGSLVLVASGAVFTNSELADAPDTALLSSMIGSSGDVVFDEAHLGIAETGSVMGLLRAFHLEGVLFGMLLPLALFIWRCARSFPPVPRSGPKQQIDGRRSFSGLVALLRRNLSPADLAAVCWQEWLKGAPRALPMHRRSLVEQELIQTGAQPIGALRNIHEILNRKRTD
jgi:hypothetical protein